MARRYSKTTTLRPTAAAHQPSGYKFGNALFVSGFIIALVGLIAAFTMPSFGLAILMFLGGLLVGFLVTATGFIMSYGKSPGGMH